LRSNLAEANEKRDYRIFELFEYKIITEAGKCCMPDDDFNLSIQGNVYAFDTTVIDLCLKRICSTKADKSNGVMVDQHVMLKGYYSYKSLPKNNTPNKIPRC
jgi:hypothetical protein